MKSLGQLAAALGLAADQPDIPITSIESDSRKVQPGSLFVAYRGVSVDGHRFIPQAIANGATAIIGELPIAELESPIPDLPYFPVPNARRALAMLAAAWEDNPSRSLGVIGVTGTDGKTTTSNLIHSLLAAADLPAGLLTTVNARIGGLTLDTGLHTTTPDAPDMQRYLRQMAEAGNQWAVIETTSHGLSQWRVAGIDYDIAVYTNVTHEHMDEHGDYDGYLVAKARLLELQAISPAKPGIPRAVILNADDRSYPRLLAFDPAGAFSYGIDGGDIRAEDIIENPDGLQFTIRSDMRPPLIVQTPLVGRFNVYNCLAAAAVGFTLGLSGDTIQAGLAQMAGIPGRMERIERGQDFIAIVDFAHTPFALEAALNTARTLTSGKVICVFGSAGLRDVAKRRMMGEIAGRLADLTVITAEDPRTEDLQSIMSISQHACEEMGGNALCEGDRYTAMQVAIAQAQPGDVVIVCGKGHEQSMCFGVIEYPWDDRIALTHALDAHLGQATDPPPLLLPTYKT
ncbi:MAG: UDP-N-acetylmuramoyl-L-alanyl-D-glutamate--2,6-diaminopimelate ligase [Caldilineales bacterium]|nr:UDP-N-acetylmuramoyl-L-alanyl-D-glutamate--2,6-diaminopimelate ligase [Caldilineales bacterium]